MKAFARLESSGKSAHEDIIRRMAAQSAKNAGKMIPVPPEEKWLTDMENESKGVSMFSICRDFLKQGRKEGYDVGYTKGYMAAQSKKLENGILEPGPGDGVTGAREEDDILS